MNSYVQRSLEHVILPVGSAHVTTVGSACVGLPVSYTLSLTKITPVEDTTALLALNTCEYLPAHTRLSLSLPDLSHTIYA